MTFYSYEGAWRGEDDLSHKAQVLDDYLLGVDFDDVFELENALENPNFQRKLCQAYIEDKYTYLGKFSHVHFEDRQEGKDDWKAELKALKTSFTAYKRTTKTWRESHHSWYADGFNLCVYLKTMISEASPEVVDAFYHQFCEPDIDDFDDWDPDFLH